MNVFEFDIEQGIYHFELSDLSSRTHSHPTIEVVYATKGMFSIVSPTVQEEQATFAIIQPNVQHSINGQGCELKVLMIESYNDLLHAYLETSGIPLKDGVFCSNDEHGQLFTEIETFVKNNDLRNIPDERIQQCLTIIDHEYVEYETMLTRLTSSVHLSESRLSHLFKEHIGVSLKKYLVWSRLKRAIYLTLNQGLNLTEASHKAGFFDQAHLSNAFKKFLGVTPVKSYNSRTVQF